MIKHKQNRIGTYKRCKCADFDSDFLKAQDVICPNMVYYDTSALVRPYAPKAIWRQTHNSYKQNPPRRPVIKMITASETQQLHEVRKARAEMQANLKPSERAFLNRKKRFQPNEAEALLFNMTEEVTLAQQSFTSDETIYPEINSKMPNDLTDYGTFSDDIAPDRRKYNSLSFANSDEYVRISGATPYFRKLERYMRGVLYHTQSTNPQPRISDKALWFIWAKHRHNIAEYARMSLDTATAKDSQIDNKGKDDLQKVAYYVRLRGLARACLLALDYWAYHTGRSGEIPPAFTA